MRNKTIAVLCLLCVLLMMTASCGNGAVDSTQSGTTAETSPTATNEGTTEADTKIHPDLASKDFGGKEINFLVMGKDRVPTNYSMEIYAEAENGDIINDAVFRRNLFVEGEYNVRITESASNNLPNDARKSIAAGDNSYQVFMMSLTDLLPFIQDGSLADLKKVPNIDLTKPWWNQQANIDVPMHDKMFFTTGDLNIMDNNAVWATLFNKRIFVDNALEMPYKLVEEGKWTLDKLAEYSKIGTKDLNGDAVMDEFDSYGFISESVNTYVLAVGSGNRIVRSSSTSEPEITVDTPLLYSALGKIMPIQNDEANVQQVEKYTNKYKNPWSEVNRVMFREGRGSIYITGILSATYLRDMEDDFGIIPIPKLDENQDRYYTIAHMGNMSAISIPKTNSDMDMTGFILEALSAESMYTLTPAYYDKLLSVKVARDAESTKMLDIILKSVIFDAGYIYNIGAISSVFADMTMARADNFKSRYDKIVSKAENDLTKLMASIKDNM